MKSKKQNSSPPVEIDAEFEATSELIKLGLEMIETGAPTISPEAIHTWMLGPEDAPFPKPDIFR